MLSSDYVYKRELIALMEAVIQESNPATRIYLNKLLTGMDGMDNDIKPRGEPNSLSLADWGDAFVIALNNEMNPRNVLYRRVKGILNYANEADCNNISMDEIDTALEALKKGLDLNEQSE